MKHPRSLISFVGVALGIVAGSATLTAFAALTFTSDTITSDGALNMSVPAGENVTVTGSANSLVFRGATSTNPVLIQSTGTDASIPIKIAGKGPQGYIQAGPDTFGVGGWSSYNIALEIFREEAVKQRVNEVWVESHAADLNNSTGIALAAKMGTQGAGATQNVNTLTGLYGEGNSTLPAGRTVNQVLGGNMQAYITGGGTATEATGLFTQVLADSGSNIGKGYGITTWLYDITDDPGTGIGYAFYGDYLNDIAMAESYGFWMGDMSGSATNPYFIWYDSPGVYRIKADGVMAYYNPAFTKYTPGATNFERIVQQWNGNTAEYGPEAGGTGTQRPLRLLGSSVEAAAYKVGSSSGPSWTAGSGAPAGGCTTGSLYSRTDGGTNTTLYVCESAAWAAK